MDKNKMDKIKKMNTQELLQSMVYDMDQIRGYVRYLALIVLFGMLMAVIIGVWIGTQLSNI